MTRRTAGAGVPTVWLLGDGLRRDAGALRGRRPGEVRVLLVESAAAVGRRPYHRQRLHVVLSAMEHLAAELRGEGFAVDHRRAPTLAAGVAAHRVEFRPPRIVAMEPTSWEGRALAERLGVETVPSDQFLCPEEVFAGWARGRRRLVMEDFYRAERVRLGVLMDGEEPVSGRWNHDADNREPPPRDGRSWPALTRFEPDDIDRAVLARLPGASPGADPDGTWPVTRSQALVRLEEFIRDGLPVFGPHEDAMLAGEWKLAHSALACSLNLGLLSPREVVDAAEAAYRAGRVPIQSAEGFIRQVMGWREYIRGVYRLMGPGYAGRNALGAGRPVPPALRGAPTAMACVSDVVAKVGRHGWAHHIERLMVLGNLGLLAGVEPRAMTDWFRAGFVDGEDWVMVPNVVGMALHADGGAMATKPYAAGGAYIDRMSDHCRGCAFDPRRRTGERACPFTTLYWDFLARNADRLAPNHRMARQFAAMRRLADLPDVRRRAARVLELLDAGSL